MSVPQATQWWVAHDQLDEQPTVDEWLPDVAPGDGTRTRRLSYGEGQVELLAVNGGGHTWPGGVQYLPASVIGHTSRDFSASETIWEFFAR
jgi:polyhydroxybutyrate depolymerase